MKKFLKHFTALVMVIILFMSNAVNVAASEAEEAAINETNVTTQEDMVTEQDVEDDFAIATMFDATSETELRQDKSKNKFFNTSNNLFYTKYAKDEEYFIGTGKDESTGLSYTLILYEEKFYLVNSKGSRRYNGAYDNRSFVKCKSDIYDEAASTVSLNITNENVEYTTELSKFTFNEDFSVSITGWYEGIHYSNGNITSDIIIRDGNYYLVSNGKIVSADNWYMLKGKKVKVTAGCVKYVFDGKQCYRYEGTKKTLVKNSSVKVENVTYRFDKNGQLANGMIEYHGDYYYYINGIMQSNVQKKVGKVYYYFASDGKAVKNTWITMKNNTIRYFDDNGICTKIYYTDTNRGSNKNKCKQLVNGKWNYVKNKIYEINGTYYLFNSDGRRYKGTKWYQENKKTFYYIQKGVVVNKLSAKSDTYKFYKCDGISWKLVKNEWIPNFQGIRMKTNNKGLVTSKYYTDKYSKKSYRGSFWNYANSKWSKVKNSLVEVDGKYYCINRSGKTVKSKGWYTFNSRKAAYVSRLGKVYKYVYYDSKQRCSIYKTGYSLSKSSEGICKAEIKGKTVYYYSDASGYCLKNTSKTIGDDIYKFDRYGIATQKMSAKAMNCDKNEWMGRVMNNLLGQTGMPCNVLVAQALQYAGGDDEKVKNTIKYTSFDEGGILINSANNCSAWINDEVTAEITVSDGNKWKDKTEYTINQNIVPFSYDNLSVGDVIVYYAYGDYEHVSMYIGQFDTADDVKDYLVSLGVSREKAEASVRTWGAYYDNDSTEWCIHGGMGSNSEVYISNTCYEIPMGGTSEVATKIVKIFGE